MHNTIEQLRELYKSSQVAAAVLDSFSKRERDRDNIKLRALIRRMQKDGYEYVSDEYADVLEKLAKLELGTLEKNSRGRVVGLKNIVTPLQSIGESAQGSEIYLTPWQKPKRVLKVGKKESMPLVLTFVLSGKTINISIPRDLEPDAVSRLISSLNQAAV